MQANYPKGIFYFPYSKYSYAHVLMLRMVGAQVTFTAPNRMGVGDKQRPCVTKGKVLPVSRHTDQMLFSSRRRFQNWLLDHRAYQIPSQGYLNEAVK